MSQSDLDKMVFVNIASPKNLNLDDDLVMKTTFFQVKRLKIVLHQKPYHIIQLIDTSVNVRYQILIGEKKLQE